MIERRPILDAFNRFSGALNARTGTKRGMKVDYSGGDEKVGLAEGSGSRKIPFGSKMGFSKSENVVDALERLQACRRFEPATSWYVLKAHHGISTSNNWDQLSLQTSKKDPHMSLDRFGRASNRSTKRQGNLRGIYPIEISNRN